MHFAMTQTIFMIVPRVFRRYGLWMAVGIAGIAIVGAVGRESTAGRPLGDGYSVVTVDATGQDDSTAGYAPVQMYQPLPQRFQPPKDVTQGEVPDRYRQMNDLDDLGALQTAGAMSQENAVSNDKKNDLFSPLKDKDAAELSKDSGRDTDDSLSWGWLADGVQRAQGRVETGASEKRSPSPMESSLRNDLFPGETPGVPEPARSFQGGSGFNWRSFGDEQTP